MASGPAVYAKRYLGAEGGRPGDARPGREILYYRDGPSATVAVERSAGFVSLLVNGKADASTAPADMPTQLMLGHLPLLLHAEPRAILVIGLGSGITAGAVARHPVQRLDVVEIEPAVIEASRFFREEHGDVLTDPRDPGRHRRCPELPPDHADPLRRDHLRAVESLDRGDRLAVLARILPARAPAPPARRDHAAVDPRLQPAVRGSAHGRGDVPDRLPGLSVWQVSPGDFLLLGRVDPAPLDLSLVKARYQTNPAVRRDLERIGMRGWSGLLGYFVLGPEDAARYARGAAVNTDDRLALEFSAPRALYLDTHAENGRMLRRFRTADLPEVTADSLAELENPECDPGSAATRAALGVKQ